MPDPVTHGPFGIPRLAGRSGAVAGCLRYFRPLDTIAGKGKRHPGCSGSCGCSHPWIRLERYRQRIRTQKLRAEQTYTIVGRRSVTLTNWGVRILPLYTFAAGRITDASGGVPTGASPVGVPGVVMVRIFVLRSQVVITKNGSRNYRQGARRYKGKEESGVRTLEHDLLPNRRYYRSGLLLLRFLLRLPGRM